LAKKGRKLIAVSRGVKKDHKKNLKGKRFRGEGFNYAGVIREKL